MRTRITVGEAMTLAAHLKLGYSINSAYKHTQVCKQWHIFRINVNVVFKNYELSEIILLRIVNTRIPRQFLEKSKKVSF